MSQLTKYIKAHALKNSLEFGKTNPSIIIPKLFQHGLKKENIKSALSEINKLVKEINALSKEQKEKQLAPLLSLLPEKKEQSTELPILPNLSNKMIFRAAPFPSGALHLGHARTFLLNTMYAEKNKGKILLVIDDTIGSEEKQVLPEAYNLIKDSFKWLRINYGNKIILKSDRLEIYYDYAEKLIQKEKAYVCYCPQEKFQKLKEQKNNCPCRNKPNQLKNWEKIFSLKPGKAVLRLKTSMQDPNPAFRDRVLFKISDRPHPLVGTKYSVWPTLEMSWAIDDHLLGITHIIRGNDLLIETDVEKYIWDIFNWIHPTVIHHGLIKLEGTMGKISKSKAQKEIKSGEFVGWEDPRTWSLQSLKQRGILPEAIREFVKELGMTKQDTTVPIETLYSINRKLIDSTSNRYSFVKNPVEIEIINPPKIKETKVPIHPDKKAARTIPISNKIFISKQDFEKLKGKEIRLLHLYNIKLLPNNKAEFTSKENKDIPKINWVSSPNTKCKILQPDGNYDNGIAEQAIKTLKKDEVLQFERYAFVKFQKKSQDTYEFWFTHK